MFSLSNTDWFELRSRRQMLTDAHIIAAMRVLALRFAPAAHCQPPALGAVPEVGFNYVDDASVQVALRDQCHWFFTGRSANGSVYMGDSLFPRPSQNAINHICDLYANGSTPLLPVTQLPVQRQTGNTDCGLFALLNAAIFAANIAASPEAIAEKFARLHVDQRRLREFFVTALETAHFDITRIPLLPSRPHLTLRTPTTFMINCATRTLVQ